MGQAGVTASVVGLQCIISVFDILEFHIRIHDRQWTCTIDHIGMRRTDHSRQDPHAYT